MDRPALVINDLKLSAQELRDDVAVSALPSHLPNAAPGEGPAWLDVVIERELLVQEAQRLGLDRQGAFMNTIERFWKEALIKALLERKMQELTAQGRDSAEAETALERWMQDLRRQAHIEINHEAMAQVP